MTDPLGDDNYWVVMKKASARDTGRVTFKCVETDLPVDNAGLPALVDLFAERALQETEQSEAMDDGDGHEADCAKHVRDE